MKTDAEFPFQASLTGPALTKAVLEAVEAEAGRQGRDIPGTLALALTAEVLFVDSAGATLPVARVIVRCAP